MESKIRLAPLYLAKLTCKITHSSSSERLCQYQRTTKASWEVCTGLTEHLFAFPASERSSSKAPGTKGTLCIPSSRPLCSAPLAQLLSGPVGSPGRPPPGTPSLWIFLHTHHSPMTSCCGFLSLAPSLPFKRALGSLASPTRPGRLGLGTGPGWGLEKGNREGHTKPTDPTADPLPLQSSLGSATYWLDKQPSHPAPRQAPTSEPPHPPKVHPRADDSAGHRPHPDPAPATAREGPGPREGSGLTLHPMTSLLCSGDYRNLAVVDTIMPNSSQHPLLNEVERRDDETGSVTEWEMKDSYRTCC